MKPIKKNLSIPLYRVDRTDHERGFSQTCKQDGTRYAEVVMEIDAEAIIDWLGPKAMRTKGKKATTAHGAIVCYARHVKDTDEGREPKDG